MVFLDFFFVKQRAVAVGNANAIAEQQNLSYRKA